jgi:hypothetical protein
LTGCATGIDATGRMIDAEKLADYSSFSALIIGVTRYGIYHRVSQDRAQGQGGALPLAALLTWPP